MAFLNPLESEWLQCLTINKIPVISTLVCELAVLSCCVSSILIMSVFGSQECESYLCLYMVWASWLPMFLALQSVSGYHSLLYVKPADYICPWFIRQWVNVMSSCIISLLIIPLLGHSGSEWPPYFIVVSACWQWLTREWVAVVPCCILSLSHDTCCWFSSM